MKERKINLLEGTGTCDAKLHRTTKGTKQNNENAQQIIINQK